MIKNNDKYTVEKTSKGSKITFEKGCIIDYEYLWDRILIHNLLIHPAVSTILDNNIRNGSDSIKFERKIIISIEVRERKKS